MFFAKTEIETSSAHNIAILGTSALGLFLAAELQKVGHRVLLICPPHENDELNATDIIIKDSRHLSGRRHNIHSSYELDDTPQILLLASAPEQLRSNLLLVSPSRLSETTIINLTPCRPDNLICDILQYPVINAYFNGWPVQNKNHILPGNHRGITLSLSEKEPQSSLLQKIFTPTEIKISYNQNNAENFWNWLAPRAAAILLTNAQTANLSSFSRTPEGRKTIDRTIAELAALAAANETNLESSAVLSEFYNIIQDHQIPAASVLGLDRLNSLLFYGIAAAERRFPHLSGLIQQIRNKL